MEHYEKNILSFQTIRKKLWNNICNLWYGFHRETVKKRYDDMPSIVEAVPKAKMGYPCTELLKTMAENDKNMFRAVIRYYTYWHTYSISIIYDDVV